MQLAAGRLEILPVDVLDGECTVVEVFVVNAVEIDGHSVTTLAKRLHTAGRTELMVDNLPVELVGRHAVFASDFRLALRYEGENHALTFTVATVAPDGLCNISFYFKGHRAAVTAAMIRFHTRLLYQQGRYLAF